MTNLQHHAMPNISAQMVEDTWKRVGASHSAHVLAMQKRHLKTQKALTKQMMNCLLELREEAAGVGIYVYHVILETFCQVTPRPKAVRRPAMEQAWDLPIQQLTLAATAAEPHLTRYLAEALTEVDDVVLTAEEERACYRLNLIAILCLHGACGNQQ